MRVSTVSTKQKFTVEVEAKTVEVDAVDYILKLT